MSKSNVSAPKNPKDVSNVEAIKCFFGGDRKVTTEELKDLSSDDRHELGSLVCKDMGWRHKPYRPGN